MCFACITTSRRGYVDTLASLSLVVDNIWRLVSISCYSRARGIDLQPKRYTIGISWHFFTTKVNYLVLNKNRLTTLRGKLSNCSDDTFCPDIQRTLAGFESRPKTTLDRATPLISAPGVCVCGCNSAATEGRVLSLFTWTWYTSSWLLVQSEPEQFLCRQQHITLRHTSRHYQWHIIIFNTLDTTFRGAWVQCWSLQSHRTVQLQLWSMFSYYCYPHFCPLKTPSATYVKSTLAKES